MTWAAPLWLLGLLPWSALVLYLLWGRRRRTDVPFLDLWQGGAEGVRVRRRVSPPPLALALAILATLLAVLAAGGPAVHLPGFGGGSTVSVVIDRGYTMSARGTGGNRLLTLISRVQPDLLRVAPPGRRVERWIVPGPQAQTTDVSDVADAPATTSTALDTRHALRAAARSALARNEGPVIVMSDQTLGLADERVVQVSPEEPVRNARVVLVAARESPAVQVMVRVRGGPGMPRATVRVTTEGASVERLVDLKSDGEVDVFLDLPRIGAFLKAELLVDDDQPADNAAWLVREATWPRLEARAVLPQQVLRMVDVYARKRPPVESSRRLILGRTVEDLVPGEPGVVVTHATRPGRTGGPAVAPDVREHPVTRGLEFADVAHPALADAVPPPGWQPVVSAGGKVWVAAREQPTRAVWIGFETSQWARSPEFVLFCANVFSWAGGGGIGEGGEHFASYPVGALEGEWRAVELADSFEAPELGMWPGLYRRDDGTLRALHAPDIPFPLSRQADGVERLKRLAGQSQNATSLAPLFALLAGSCVGLAALAWRRRNLTGFTVPRSF